MMGSDETYTRDELNMLVDAIMGLGTRVGSPCPNGGFQQYRIRNIYVSPEVVDQAIQERLEAMVK